MLYKGNSLVKKNKRILQKRREQFCKGERYNPIKEKRSNATKGTGQPCKEKQGNPTKGTRQHRKKNNSARNGEGSDYRTTLSCPDMGNIPVCYGKSRRTVQGISRCNTTSTKLWYGKYQTVVRRIPSCGRASSKQRYLPDTYISLDKQAGIERNNPLSQA